MKMIRKIMLIMILLSTLLVGCQKTEEVTTPKEEVSTETEVGIEDEILEVNTLDRELAIDELESLEADLDEVDW
jgi:hypothetical protein